MNEIDIRNTLATTCQESEPEISREMLAFSSTLQNFCKEAFNSSMIAGSTASHLLSSFAGFKTFALCSKLFGNQYLWATKTITCTTQILTSGITFHLLPNFFATGSIQQENLFAGSASSTLMVAFSKGAAKLGGGGFFQAMAQNVAVLCSQEASSYFGLCEAQTGGAVSRIIYAQLGSSQLSMGACATRLTCRQMTLIEAQMDFNHSLQKRSTPSQANSANNSEGYLHSLRAKLQAALSPRSANEVPIEAAFEQRREQETKTVHIVRMAQEDNPFSNKGGIEITAQESRALQGERSQDQSTTQPYQTSLNHLYQIERMRNAGDATSSTYEVVFHKNSGGFPGIVQGGVVAHVGIEILTTHSNTTRSQTEAASLSASLLESRFTIDLRGKISPGEKFLAVISEDNSSIKFYAHETGITSNPFAIVTRNAFSEVSPANRREFTQLEESGTFHCINSCVIFGSENSEGLHLTPRYKKSPSREIEHVWVDLPTVAAETALPPLDELGWWMGAIASGKSGITTKVDLKPRKAFPVSPETDDIRIIAERPSPGTEKKRLFTVPVWVINKRTGEVLQSSDVTYMPNKNAADAGMGEAREASPLQAILAKLQSRDGISKELDPVRGKDRISEGREVSAPIPDIFWGDQLQIMVPRSYEISPTGMKELPLIVRTPQGEIVQIKDGEAHQPIVEKVFSADKAANFTLLHDNLYANQGSLLVLIGSAVPWPPLWGRHNPSGNIIHTSREAHEKWKLETANNLYLGAANQFNIGYQHLKAYEYQQIKLPLETAAAASSQGRQDRRYRLLKHLLDRTEAGSPIPGFIYIPSSPSEIAYSRNIGNNQHPFLQLLTPFHSNGRVQGARFEFNKDNSLALYCGGETDAVPVSAGIATSIGGLFLGIRSLPNGTALEMRMNRSLYATEPVTVRAADPQTIHPRALAAVEFLKVEPQGVFEAVPPEEARPDSPKPKAQVAATVFWRESEDLPSAVAAPAVQEIARDPKLKTPREGAFFTRRQIESLADGKHSYFSLESPGLTGLGFSYTKRGVEAVWIPIDSDANPNGYGTPNFLNPLDASLRGAEAALIIAAHAASGELRELKKLSLRARSYNPLNEQGALSSPSVQEGGFVAPPDRLTVVVLRPTSLTRATAQVVDAEGNIHYQVEGEFDPQPMRKGAQSLISAVLTHKKNLLGTGFTPPILNNFSEVTPSEFNLNVTTEQQAAYATAVGGRREFEAGHVPTLLGAFSGFIRGIESIGRKYNVELPPAELFDQAENPAAVLATANIPIQGKVTFTVHRPSPSSEALLFRLNHETTPDQTRLSKGKKLTAIKIFGECLGAEGNPNIETEILLWVVKGQMKSQRSHKFTTDEELAGYKKHPKETKFTTAFIDEAGAITGDLNAAHFSDQAGKAMGFKGRILHGVVTMGLALDAINETHERDLKEPYKATFEPIFAVGVGDHITRYTQYDPATKTFKGIVVRSNEAEGIKNQVVMECSLTELKETQKEVAPSPTVEPRVMSGEPIANKVAFLFPGQGSQKVGMGNAFLSDPTYHQILETAEKAVPGLKRLMKEGPEAELNLTQHTQPAILTMSVGISGILALQGVRAHYFVGHSLGELSALVALGVIPMNYAPHLVAERGRFMQEAVPAQVGAMAAVIGVESEKLAEICATVSKEKNQIVVIANQNGGGQLVISGHAEAVNMVLESVKALSKKAITKLLPVSAPFHSPLMETAQQRFSPLLRALPLYEFDLPLRTPLISTVDAALKRRSAEAFDTLNRQIPAPVLFEPVIRQLLSLGVTTFIEVGPGSVLGGLVRRIGPKQGIHIFGTETPDQITQVVEHCQSIGARQVIANDFI